VASDVGGEGVYIRVRILADPNGFDVPYPYITGTNTSGSARRSPRGVPIALTAACSGTTCSTRKGSTAPACPILGARSASPTKNRSSGRSAQDGSPGREIPKSRSVALIDVFPAATMEDLKSLGAAIDWTRSFITTRESSLRRLRPLAVPSSPRRRLRPHRQAPRHLVPEGPGPRSGDTTGSRGRAETPVEYTLLSSAGGRPVPLWPRRSDPRPCTGRRTSGSIRTRSTSSPGSGEEQWVLTNSRRRSSPNRGNPSSSDRRFAALS